MKGAGGRPPPRDDDQDEEEEVELAAMVHEDEPMIPPLAQRSSPPTSPKHGAITRGASTSNTTTPASELLPRRGIRVPILDPPPPRPPSPSTAPSGPPALATRQSGGGGGGGSAHCSKAPSDLHLWVEPGLADAEVQRERRQAKRREALSGLFHSPTLPCLAWLRRYQPRRDFLWDLQAGVVVGVMVIPQVRYRVWAACVPFEVQDSEDG